LNGCRIDHAPQTKIHADKVSGQKGTKPLGLGFVPPLFTGFFGEE
jgi:hypothetical protein